MLVKALVKVIHVGLAPQYLCLETCEVSLSQQILDSIDSAQLSTSLRRSFSCLQPVNPL